MVAEVAEQVVVLPSQLAVAHGHTWHLVADEHDEFGRVRVFECDGCGQVRYE